MKAVMAPTENFQCTVHGKWILAGEHAVLRGSPAIVFPVFGKELTLSWVFSEDTFQTGFLGPRGRELQILFSGVFDRALEMTGHSNLLDLRKGKFTIESSLPVGAGLGASAALSVAIGRWFVFRKLIDETDLFSFCRNLENLFHGESSGVDVAASIEDRGLFFSRKSPIEGFDCSWSPYWYISYSGVRGVTSECVSQVKEMIASDPERGAQIDEKMKLAVEKAFQALHVDEVSGLPVLIEAIESAGQCFQEWGLVNESLRTHMDHLKKAGALAVKPTGSGLGGYVLSLWKAPLSESSGLSPELCDELIPVFKNPSAE